MLDFVKISVKRPKNGRMEVYPKFIIKKSEDLMIRGGDFYAVWVESRGLWSTDEQDVIDLVDAEIDSYILENKAMFEDNPPVRMYMWDSDTGTIDRWHKYCQRQSRDNYHPLDEKLIFSNMPSNKTDYASKRLSYPLEKGPCPNWEKLVSTLYSPEERQKIEWSIGSVVSGDSKKIQKFLVLYGAAGTGKSTILNVIQQLFDGYYSVFDAKALGSSSNSFALEAFKSNPLVAIQHDGDLSRIEDNTRLNSLVSHELMTVNEKFKSTYTNRFNAFLFMGTNKPVKITDGKSGLIRRLIDVAPTGDKLPTNEYNHCMSQIKFELGAIASHCLEVYKDNPNRYDTYIPKVMLGASNDFYNYVVDSYFVFKEEDGTTLNAAWEMYKTYCEDARVTYPMPKRQFKEELKNYFREYNDIYQTEDGEVYKSYFYGFKTDTLDVVDFEKNPGEEIEKIEFNATKSLFDEDYADCLAQYAKDDGTPRYKWDSVTTKLRDLDTSKLHYVRVPENHIVIDFDLKGDDGNKSLEKNIEAASKFPKTYAELSKSGAGIHLHYIYKGDPEKLSRVYMPNVEIKVFSGKSSLRRQLTKCNDIPIATISSGLPLKEETPVINIKSVKSEKGLRRQIIKCLNREYMPNTKPNVDFIVKILNDAYNSGLKYDVSDLHNNILIFAMSSHHQSKYCIEQVSKMKFKSEEPSEPLVSKQPIVFFDVEVFPNLFVVVYKAEGEDQTPVKMINPKPSDIEKLIQFRLVGFNNRKYDNHILYGRLVGYNNEALYKLSQNIIERKTGFFGEAYNISYTDIYDFASAPHKKSLKKWEIELGIHHQELGLPWDKPVDENLWPKVADYCVNDVIATEAVWNHLQGDFTAREILADLAGMTVNDTTNQLTTRIIFGKEKHPKLVYTDLATGEQYY